MEKEEQPREVRFSFVGTAKEFQKSRWQTRTSGVRDGRRKEMPQGSIVETDSLVRLQQRQKERAVEVTKQEPPKNSWHREKDGTQS